MVTHGKKHAPAPAEAGDGPRSMSYDDDDVVPSGGALVYDGDGGAGDGRSGDGEGDGEGDGQSDGETFDGEESDDGQSLDMGDDYYEEDPFAQVLLTADGENIPEVLKGIQASIDALTAVLDKQSRVLYKLATRLT